MSFEIVKPDGQIIGTCDEAEVRDAIEHVWTHLVGSWEQGYAAREAKLVDDTSGQTVASVFEGYAEVYRDGDYTDVEVVERGR